MDKKDKKRVYEPKHGVTLTWDNAGNCFVSMPVNNIPRKQFEDWIKACKNNYSGKRWDMIQADHINAKAYDTIISLRGASDDELPEETDMNPDGLLNGGNEDGK